MTNHTFVFDTPVDDLPDGFGGKYHMICNAVKSVDLSELDVNTGVEDVVDWALSKPNKYLYINGHPETIIATPSRSNSNLACEWHILLDGGEYTVNELSAYFDINIDGNTFIIKAINKVMANYILTVAIHDASQTYYDSVEMEVRI